MPLPKSKASRKAALLNVRTSAPPQQTRALIHRADDARRIAAEACEFPVMRLKAPRTLADFRFVTNLPLEMTYAERQRFDAIPGSWEILTQDDGRVEAG